MSLNTEEFVDLIDSMIDDKQIKSISLAKIDDFYNGEGKPRLKFDGESKATLKRYPHLSSYKPTAGDRVMVANISGTHVILGKIGAYENYGESTEVDWTGLDYNWSGTSLGIKKESESSFSYVNLQGPRGEEGEKGDRGEQGPQGPTGPQGDTGPAGVGLQYDWNGTSLGVKREDQTTYSYVNLKGAKGDKGDTGSQGPQGPKGEQGPQGESGVTTPLNGFFTLSGDAEGNLYAYYADGADPPQFEVETNNDIYIIIPDN